MSRHHRVLFTPIVLLLFLCSLTACGWVSNGPPQEKCATKPVAIFSDTMQIVQKHTFEARGENSYEEVHLSDSIQLEVLQSGCDLIRREFRITRKGNFKRMEDEFWIRGAMETLGYLANQSPRLYGFNQFVSLIATALDTEDFKFGQPFYPDPVYAVTIDKMVTSKQGKVIVVLEDKGL